VSARRPPRLDWSHRVDRIITRWNRLGKPENLREGVTAMTDALTAWSNARNRLIGSVQELEKTLDLEEHK
jgi:hypothetical protein